MHLKGKKEMKYEILKAINKAIKQLCCTAQNRIDHRTLCYVEATPKFKKKNGNKFSTIYVFLSVFLPNLFVIELHSFSNFIKYWDLNSFHAFLFFLLIVFWVFLFSYSNFFFCIDLWQKSPTKSIPRIKTSNV